jgi:beta-lactam-binding protein with PASTA domain
VSEYDPSYIPGQRRPGLGTVVFISALTSAAVTIFTMAALIRWGALGAAIGLSASWNAPPPQPETLAARIPDVVGMSAEAADELLSGRKLRLVVHERKPHPTVPVGSVISQTPLAQSRIGPGGEVAVVLSTGPGRSSVPELTGKSVEDAKKALEAAGLHAGPVTEGDGTGAPGSVIATTPAASVVVEPGSSVALTIVRATIAVPRLLGEHIRKAREMIAQDGLTVGVVSEVYDEHRRGYLVLTQDPQPGTRVAPGSKINLVVNQGD